MAHSNTWDAAFNASPGGSTKLSQSDDAQRAAKAAIQERIALEHYFDMAGDNDQHGEHKKGSARAYYIDESTSDPTVKPDGSTALDADDDQGRLLIIDDDSGDSDVYYLKVYADSGEWVGVRGYNSADSDTDETISGEWTFDTYYPKTLTSGYPDDDAQLIPKKFIDANFDTLIGMIAAFPVTRTTAQGWILCDGSNVSRTTYARLFDVISTTFGAGDGSTTFGLPDIPGGCFLMSYNTAVGTAPAVSLTDGGDVSETVGDHDHGAGSGETNMAAATIDLTGQVTESGTADIEAEASHYHLMFNGVESLTTLTSTSYSAGNYYSSTDGNGATNNEEYYICANTETPDLGRTSAGTSHTHTDAGHTHAIELEGVGSHRHTFSNAYANGSSSQANRPNHVTVYWYIYAGLEKDIAFDAATT